MGYALLMYQTTTPVKDMMVPGSGLQDMRGERSKDHGVPWSPGVGRSPPQDDVVAGSGQPVLAARSSWRESQRELARLHAPALTYRTRPPARDSTRTIVETRIRKGGRLPDRLVPETVARVSSAVSRTSPGMRCNQARSR